MLRAIALVAAIGFSGESVAGTAIVKTNMPKHAEAPHYLRVSIARWNMDTSSPEAERIFHE
jgi:hypothetical protein